MMKTRGFLLAATALCCSVPGFMNKAKYGLLAVGLLLFAGCSDEPDNNSNNSRFPDKWTINGEEKILELRGLEQYNGYYVVTDFYPEGFGDPSGGLNLNGACGGANSQDRKVENGKIELTIVDFSNLLDEDLKVKDEIVFLPCPDKEYMISLLLVKNKKDLENDPMTMLKSTYYYTDGERECVLFSDIGLGTLPFLEFGGPRTILDFSKFTKVTEIDPNNPLASLACMFN